MRIGRFFIDRPVLAIVLSILITTVGCIAGLSLPITQYPEVAPPTITIRAQYPGANAQTVADTVAAPIEQEVNGVDSMLYMYSQSTGDGRMDLSVTFRIGTDLNAAQVLVQNRVSVAEARLPEEVRRVGVTVRKASPDLLLAVSLTSRDGSRDGLYLSNYAFTRIRDVLTRLDGVGDINVVGAQNYAMRVWLDPGRIAALNMSASDIVAAIRAQNVEVAGGMLSVPPVDADRALQPALTLQGRLSDPAQFGDIVIRTGEEGRVTRLSDVARIELGAQEYVSRAYLNDQPAVALLVQQRPGSNALNAANEVIQTMERLARDFPEGMQHTVNYNPTAFIQQSASALGVTIAEAVILVIAVVLLFLQTWRATLIPVLAIPVSLVGTLAVMAALGYSLNNLTLFGLILAVGIVVDDAIVVVEKVEAEMARGLSAIEASRVTMDEVGGALVSIALVLSAVFVPTAFLSGITGQFFQQFAVTVAVATLISCFVSLTLSPALSARLLRSSEGGHGGSEEGRTHLVLMPFVWLTKTFNRAFDRLADLYANLVARLVRARWLMLIVYAGLVGGTAYALYAVPRGFVPVVDQGSFIISVQLPAGASLQRTDAVVRDLRERLRAAPGVAHLSQTIGFSGSTRTFNPAGALLFVALEPFDRRAARGLTRAGILADLRRRVGQVENANINVIQPPSIRGLGTAGGFTMRIQDVDGNGPAMLEQVTRDLVAQGNRDPALTGLFTPFVTNVPQFHLDLDRVKARMLNVPVESLFDTLEIYLGSRYINDFNLIGRTFRVIAQAESEFRLDPESLSDLKIRSTDGVMVPLGSIMTFHPAAGPDCVPRYNLYPAAELNGDTRAGVSSATGMAAMENAARAALPPGMRFEWTDLSYQQSIAGNTALYIFPLCVLFVFLVLAAQYESFTLPLAVILIVPMCLGSAIAGIIWMGHDNNLLVQIGFVVLIGLAAKNAILIVEFARQREDQGGMDPTAAVVEACRMRLRPILMTSLAFILGVVPLMTGEGAGAELRSSIGTAVFFGMIGVTVFGLIFTPAFYVVIRQLGSRRWWLAAATGDQADD
jgi:hydrophobe/amphiphile efflux-1 (HAE1) family protein